MTLHRISRLAIVALLTLAACKGDKVKPDGADAGPTPDEIAKKDVADYKARQAAFAEKVLGDAASPAKVAEKVGKQAEVGSVKLRDALLKLIGQTPECFKNGRAMDPYLSGNVSFYIHINVTGSDIVRVQESTWTSQAGNLVDKCFTDAGRNWKIDMGVSKPGHFILQVLFK